MNDLNERDLMCAKHFVSHEKMNERTARRFMLVVKLTGFSNALLLYQTGNKYNPVPYAACKRHLAMCDKYIHNDELWNAHSEMAAYFIMLQKNR